MGLMVGAAVYLIRWAYPQPPYGWYILEFHPIFIFNDGFFIPLDDSHKRVHNFSS